jgi:feruloyl esterase
MRWSARSLAAASVVASAATLPGLAVHALAPAAAPMRCDSLRDWARPATTVVAVEPVEAGAFSLPGASAADRAAYRSLPAFCRVSLRLTPTADSNIAVEVWLPSAGWNRKLLAVGNGGFSGAISYAGLSGALQRGYAATSTDTGHEGSSAAFAVGHPERLVDYAYRSEHEMTIAAKALVSAFYGDAPQRSYWNGCSAGGKQGLMEAQRYPDDFDGIVAGAPASNWTGRAAQSIWIAQAVHRDAASALPPVTLAALHRAALAACDGADGVADGVIEDPPHCRFDPASLQCAGGASSDCLTARQVEVARTIYAPVIDPRTGRTIFPGHEPGSEQGWTTMAGPQPFGTGQEHFRYLVFDDPQWDYRTFDWSRDLPRTERPELEAINALDPNLGPFFRHGSKLLQYHGWSDPQISPGSSVAYYESVLAENGGEAAVSGSYRLFMVPGMAHCGGGEGPNVFDMVTALEHWVEQGTAPDRIIASRVVDGRVTRTRPLCPYPQTARYSGTGSPDAAEHFTCQR